MPWIANILTICVTFCFLLVPEVVREYELWFFAALMVLVGIPHGATDWLVFRHTRQEHINAARRQFYILYGSMMGGYALVWLLLPPLALVVFLIASFYHFGQSNFTYVDFREQLFLKRTVYCIWGAFVALMPILCHTDEATPIIRDIIGEYETFLLLLQEQSALLIYGLYLLLGICYLSLYLSHLSDLSVISLEIVNVAVLSLLFFNTSLIISFTVYFAIWHSLHSFSEELTQLRALDSRLEAKDLIVKALPFTAVAILGMLLLFFALEQFSLDVPYLGIFFVLTSLVTLPHMWIVERLYEPMHD